MMVLAFSRGVSNLIKIASSQYILYRLIPLPFEPLVRTIGVQNPAYVAIKLHLSNLLLQVS
jgi:hypothetical protein